MSIKLMSAIFETEFYDLPMNETDETGRERKTKASTAKLVMLAIADHANDQGESAYPALTKLEKKTALSRQGVVDALTALKFNGLLLIDPGTSKLGTNNYTINLECFPSLQPNYDPSQATLLVKPLDYPSQATLPEVVKPLDSNHSLTVLEPSSATPRKKVQLPQGSGVDWLIRGGVESSEIAQLNEREQRERKVADFWEKAMGYNPLPWWSEKDLTALLRFLMGKTTEEMEVFIAWSKRPFSAFSPEKARAYPRRVIELWPQAFAAKEAEPSYYKRPAVLDEDESNYVIPD